ncbi:MAG: serine/threonine protein kinase, partial [Planctomycetota bacterium]
MFIRVLYIQIILCFPIEQLVAEDWPGFLGANGSARSASTVPITWNDNENLAWKVNLPGSGSSSPIITGDRLMVTCYVEGADPKRQLLCFDKVSGETLWTVDFPIDYQEDA